MMWLMEVGRAAATDEPRPGPPFMEKMGFRRPVSAGPDFNSSGWSWATGPKRKSLLHVCIPVFSQELQKDIYVPHVIQIPA